MAWTSNKYFFGDYATDDDMKDDNKMDIDEISSTQDEIPSTQDKIPSTQDEIPSTQDEIHATEIILISTHGALITRQNKEKLSQPKLVRVPDNMEVIKITITAPGIGNITNESDILIYYNSIIEVFGELRNPYKSIDEISRTLNELIKKFQTQFKEQLKIKNTQIIGVDDNASYVRDFKRHSNKAFQVYYLKPGSLITDKEFSRTTDDNMTDLDFRILNVAYGEDLLSKDNDTITSGEIMNYFSENGTRRLIIFDFSCSTCLTTMTERATRRLRRTLITEGTGHGGNRKQTRIRNKNNRKTQKRNKNNRKTKHKKRNKH